MDKFLEKYKVRKLIQELSPSYEIDSIADIENPTKKAKGWPVSLMNYNQTFTTQQILISYRFSQRT